MLLLRGSYLSEAQRRAYVIADNKLALNAGWDEHLLTAEFLDLEALDFDLALTGFDPDEIAALVAAQAATEGLTDPDAVLEPRRLPWPHTAIVKRWQEFVGKDATLDGDGRTFDEVAAAR